MKNKTVLAFDIGTGSGRGILGYWSEKNGLEKIEEIYRFDNGFIEINDGYYWDHLHIYSEILACLKLCKEKNIELDSIGIDTWAQDYGYLGPAGELLGYVRAYRDPVFSDCGIRTNARLEKDKTLRPAERETAQYFLFMAYVLIQMLTGEAAYDESLTSIGGVYGKELLPRKVDVGEIIGYTGKAVMDATGYDRIPVACTLAHDTSSAVYSIPVRDNYMWVSSGSFAMLGIVTNGIVIEEKDANTLGFTNTALDGNRICTTKGSGSGMYHIQQCMKKWKADGLDISYSMLTEYALSHRTERFFDFYRLNQTALDMPAEINAQLVENGMAPADTPEEMYEIFCNSLAREISDELLKFEALLPEKFDRIYVISGGSRADGVNRRIKELTGKQIFTGIVEASAIGNILAQIRALCGRDINSGKLLEMRRLEV